jgi:hypothetical protein
MPINFLQQLDLNQTPVKELVPEKITTTERGQLSGVVAGRIIFNTTTSQFQVWDGTSWVALGEANFTINSASKVVSGGSGAIVTLTGPDIATTDTFDITALTAEGITIDGSAADVIKIKHADTSNIGDLSATSRTYVTGLTFDTFGHVTALTTSSETVTQRTDESVRDVVEGMFAHSEHTNVTVVNDDSGNKIKLTSPSDTTYALENATVSGGSKITLTPNTGTATEVSVIGTGSEVEVTHGSGSIQVGLPNDVVIGNNLSVTNDLSVSGDASITGSLTITGDLISTNTERIDLEDSVIQLNSNATGTPTDAADAGLEVNRGSSTNVKLLWDESSDRWTFSNNGTDYYDIPISTEYDSYGDWDLKVDGTKVLDVTSGVAIDFVNGTNTDAVWDSTGNKVKINVANASTTAKGVVELATSVETKAGTSSSLAVTPAGLEATLDNKKKAVTISGDGSTTSFTVTYGFTVSNGIDVMIQVVGLSGDDAGRNVFPEVDRDGTTSAEIKFASAPASGTNYRVLCLNME